MHVKRKFFSFCDDGGGGDDDDDINIVYAKGGRKFLPGAKNERRRR
jgi:hypothetical protein